MSWGKLMSLQGFFGSFREKKTKQMWHTVSQRRNTADVCWFSASCRPEIRSAMSWLSGALRMRKVLQPEPRTLRRTNVTRLLWETNPSSLYLFCAFTGFYGSFCFCLKGHRMLSPGAKTAESLLYSRSHFSGPMDLEPLVTQVHWSLYCRSAHTHTHTHTGVMNACISAHSIVLRHQDKVESLTNLYPIMLITSIHLW